MVKLFDETRKETWDCDVVQTAFLEFLAAKYRRKLNKGEVVDLDILAKELKSVSEVCDE